MYTMGMRSKGSQNMAGRRDFTEDEIGKVRALAGEGLHPQKIAQRIGRSSQSITYICAKHKIALPAAVRKGTEAWSAIMDAENGEHDLSQYKTAPLTHGLAYPRGSYRGK
jgi:hypothetical protein